MMEETAECGFAETFVFPGIEDELVPQIIGHFRRHSNQTIARTQAHEKKIAKRFRDSQLVLFSKMRVVPCQTSECGGGKDIRTNELFSLEMTNSRSIAHSEHHTNQQKCARNKNHCFGKSLHGYGL